MKRSQMVLKLVVGLMGIFPELVFAQMAPAQFNFDGTLLDSSGVPITSASVVLKLEIWDKAGTCALYSEQQSVDLSSTAGAFSVKIGAGTGPLNHLEGSALFDGKLFLNSGATGSFSGCPGGVTLAPGDARALRVSYNLGAGFVLLTPDFQMTSTPYTLIADTLQGKVPSDLILVHSDASNALTQVNAEYRS